MQVKKCKRIKEIKSKNQVFAGHCRRFLKQQEFVGVCSRRGNPVTIQSIITICTAGTPNIKNDHPIT